MDYFDRQKRISGWNQDELTNTVAVCFGVGGLGSVVSINLCRLGVGKIILIDYDIVDYHNLNRQLLYTKNDVGQYKVNAAKANLESSHNLVTNIETYNLNIIENWAQVVNIAQGATVIFNMIDYGDYFDLAAQSLAIKLKVPLVQGGAYSQCVNVEFFLPGGKPCLCCSSDLDPSVVSQITPDKILDLASLNFLPKNSNPVGLSNTYLCGTCGMMMTSKFGEYIINKSTNEIHISNRNIYYVNTMESVIFNIDPKENCLLCKTDNKKN